MSYQIPTWLKCRHPLDLLLTSFEKLTAQQDIFPYYFVMEKPLVGQNWPAT